MKRKSAFDIALLILGLLCAIAGLLTQASAPKQVYGLLLGIGAGLTGMSISNLLVRQVERKNPQIEKQAAIERHDERNRMIRDRAKAKAGDIMRWVVMGLAYFTILMATSLWITLALIGIFLLYQVASLYFWSKYQKEY